MATKIIKVDGKRYRIPLSMRDNYAEEIIRKKFNQNQSDQNVQQNQNKSNQEPLAKSIALATPRAGLQTLNTIAKQSENMPHYLSQILDLPKNIYSGKISPGIPGMSDVTSGLMSLLGRNPLEQKALANIQEILSGTQPTTSQKFEQSLGRIIPSMAVPELQPLKLIPGIGGALSRILPQSAYGAATSENKKEGALKFGGMQGLIELLKLPLKTIGLIAEQIHPEKFAGQIAEKIRNLGKKGYKEGEEAYSPVNAKYNDSMVTPVPKKYLGFDEQDTQWFKPDVMKRYKTFNSEPNFKNLHDLQSEMGKYPELKPFRDEVNQKIESFLSQDPDMLESYLNGRRIMREKYYPYVSNDTLRNINKYEKPIQKHDPYELNKAIQESNIIQESNRMNSPKTLTPSKEEINRDSWEYGNVPEVHPLVSLSQQLSDKLEKSNINKYLIPTVGTTLAGNALSPLGAGIGSATGLALGHTAAIPLAKMVQGEWIKRALENYVNPMTQGAGRSLIEYNMQNK